MSRRAHPSCGRYTILLRRPDNMTLSPKLHGVLTLDGRWAPTSAVVRLLVAGQELAAVDATWSSAVPDAGVSAKGVAPGTASAYQVLASYRGKGAATVALQSGGSATIRMLLPAAAMPAGSGITTLVVPRACAGVNPTGGTVCVQGLCALSLQTSFGPPSAGRARLQAISAVAVADGDLSVGLGNIGLRETAAGTVELGGGQGSIDVAPGTYKLRVQGVAADSNVTQTCTVAANSVYASSPSIAPCNIALLCSTTCVGSTGACHSRATTGRHSDRAVPDPCLRLFSVSLPCAATRCSSCRTAPRATRRSAWRTPMRSTAWVATASCVWLRAGTRRSTRSWARASRQSTPRA